MRSDHQGAGAQQELPPGDQSASTANLPWFFPLVGWHIVTFRVYVLIGVNTFSPVTVKYNDLFYIFAYW